MGMKTRLSAMLACVLLFPGTAVLSQGIFRNLDFESTSLSPGDPFGSVPVSFGMPGWTVHIGAISQSTVLFDDSTLGISSVSILGIGNSLSPVIEGRFMAFLNPIADPANNQIPADVSLEQTGLVPANARSILLKARGGLAGFIVAVGGQTIGIVPLMTTTDFTLYGGEISNFAGQSATLTITALSNVPRGPNVLALDSISFSSSPVPEPRALLLFALAILACRPLSKRSP